MSIDKKTFLNNFISNWYLVLSGISFFLLEPDITFSSLHVSSLVIAAICLIVLAGVRGNVCRKAFSTDRGLVIYGCLSSIGVVCYGVYYLHWQTAGGWLIPLALGLGAMPFVLTYVLLILGSLAKGIKESGLIGKITISERILYGGVFLVISAAVFCIYAKTNAFCGTDVCYDVIYVTDTPILQNPSCYLFLHHLENDIRQPLLMIAASPFLGIGFLVGYPLSLIRTFLLPFAMDFLQIAMVIAANVMLAEAMQADAKERAGFTILMSSTYACLLFSVNMEQYVVGYFWLAYCILRLSKGKRDKLAWVAATGSLITNGILALFYPDYSGVSHLRDITVKRCIDWAKKWIELGICFVGAICVFDMFDAISNCIGDVDELNSRFSGTAITAYDKLVQYTHFLRDMFLGLPGAVDTVSRDHVSYQPIWQDSISKLGLLILILAAAGFAVSAEKLLSKIAFGYVLMSLMLLPVLGWGSNENGMILYALYFCWAYAGLIFQLLLWVGEKTKSSWMVLGFSCLIAGWNLYHCIPVLQQLIAFGIEYYPL